MRKLLALTAVATLVVSLFAATASAGPPRGGVEVLAPEVSALLDTMAPGEVATVIVTLTGSADLTRIPGATRAARLRGVIKALQAQADASQRQIIELLEARQAQGQVTEFVPFWIVDAISVTATASVIRELADRSDVASITLDEVAVVPTVGPPEANLAAVGAPTAWSLGFTGQGMVVASLDSGVDATHPDLASRWRGGTNSWFDPFGQSSTPIDLTGHGTGTMGVMVGGDAGGSSIGVAPGATWIAARIFNNKGRTTATAIHASLQWLLDPDGNPNTADAPNVVNNSWSYGSGPGCDLAFQGDLQALRAAGILPVFAAGNFGPGTSSSVSPANYPEAFAVGAVNSSDAGYTYSSRGPSACGEASTVYPEIVAPGVGIRTTERYGLYQSATGTSLSAPHVAGALALLLGANPNLTADEQAAALVGTALDLGAPGPDNQFGFGRLDVAAALQWVQSPPTTTTTAPTTTTSPSTTTTSTTVPPTTTTTSASGLFADGFESGGVTVWSAAVTNGGRLRVSQAAALAGGFGLEAVISNTTSEYVADVSPEAATTYRAAFGFDPNGTTIPNRKLHDLFVGVDGAGTAFEIQVQTSGGGYQVRAVAADDRGRAQSTSWSSISDAPHSIEVAWSAASNSAGNNGEIVLTIDGSAVSSKTGIKNGSVRLDEIRMGPQSVGSGIAGTEYFDDFATLVSG